MQISISQSGDVQVSRKLLRFGERAVEAAPAFEHIAEWLMDLETEQFKSGGRRASGGWAALADGSPSFLEESGELRRSFTQRGDQNQELIITNEFLVYGSNVPYASFHQLGTTNLPQRRPLELTETDRKDVVRKMQRWITTGEIL